MVDCRFVGGGLELNVFRLWTAEELRVSRWSMPTHGVLVADLTIPLTALLPLAYPFLLFDPKI